MIAALILSIMVGIAAIFAGALVIWAIVAVVLFLAGVAVDWMGRAIAACKWKEIE